MEWVELNYLTNMWTTVNASSEQIEKLYHKHAKPPVFGLTYSWDDEDGIGFVRCRSILGWVIQFQFRSGKPCFVSFEGLGGIRYDVNYPEGELLKRLTELGEKADAKFWAGGQI